MIFTIELHNGTLHYRLKKDGSWRNISIFPQIHGNDFVTDNTEEVRYRSNLREKTIIIDGTNYDINPSVNPSKNKPLYYESLVFRQKFPESPDRQQLVSVVASGDDSNNNCLVLTVDGTFDLREIPDYDYFQNDPSVVVRHECSIAGNRYVGVEASNDHNFISELFISSMEYWLEHLQSHKTQFYSDIPAKTSLADIESALRSIRKNWKPEY